VIDAGILKAFDEERIESAVGAVTVLERPAKPLPARFGVM
jgi:hypothetical protein